MKLKSGLMILAILLVAASAQAGWVMQQQTPGGDNTVYVQDNMMRAGSGQRGVIYNLNQGTVTMLNPGRKVYWTGRPDQLNQQMNQALDARMEQALQRVPPEQRAQMRAMMNQRMGRGMPPHRRPPAQVEVKSTSDYQNIAGYKARKYRVLVNGRLRQDMWVASVPGFVSELDMGQMMKLMHSMRLGGRRSVPGQGWRTSPAMLDLMRKGMPMMIVDHGPAGPQQVMKITKVEKKPLDKALFAPPADYRQVDFRNMMR